MRHCLGPPLTDAAYRATTFQPIAARYPLSGQLDSIGQLSFARCIFNIRRGLFASRLRAKENVALRTVNVHRHCVSEALRAPSAVAVEVACLRERFQSVLYCPVRKAVSDKIAPLESFPPRDFT